MSNSVLVPAVSDSEGSTFKDNCVKSNKHRPILSAAEMTLVSGNINCLYIFEGVSRRTSGLSRLKDKDWRFKDKTRTKDSGFDLRTAKDQEQHPCF